MLTWAYSLSFTPVSRTWKFRLSKKQRCTSVSSLFFYCSTSTSVKSRYWQAVCSLSQVVRSAGDRYSRLALQDLWYCWIIDMQIFPAATIKRLIYRQNMVKTKQKLTKLDYIHELCRVGPHYTVWYCMRMEATILIMVRHNPTRQKKRIYFVVLLFFHGGWLIKNSTNDPTTGRLSVTRNIPLWYIRLRRATTSTLSLNRLTPALAQTLLPSYDDYW